MSVYICGTRVPVLASIPLRSVLSPSILHSTPIQVRKDEDLLLLLEEETLRPASTPVDSTLVHSTPILRSSRPGSGVCVCVCRVRFCVGVAGFSVVRSVGTRWLVGAAL